MRREEKREQERRGAAKERGERASGGGREGEMWEVGLTFSSRLRFVSVKHTSASLTINENCDRDVRRGLNFFSFFWLIVCFSLFALFACVCFSCFFPFLFVFFFEILLCFAFRLFVAYCYFAKTFFFY